MESAAADWVILRTWSATQKFIAARGFDPVDSLTQELGTVWKNPEECANDMAIAVTRWPFGKRADQSTESPVPIRTVMSSEYDDEHEQKGKRRALRPAPPLSLSSFSLAIAL